MKTILFYARSYLNSLALELHPYLADYFNVVYITQTKRERLKLGRRGLQTALSFQEYIVANHRNSKLKNRALEQAVISHIQQVTDFPVDPIQSDRFLCHLPKPAGDQIAFLIYNYSCSLFQEYTFAGLISEPVTMFTTHCLYYQAKSTSAKSVLWCSGFLPGTMYFTDTLKLLPNRELSHTEENISLTRDQASEYVDAICNKVIGPVYNSAYNNKKRSGLLSLLRSRKGREPLILESSLWYRAYVITRFAKSILSGLMIKYSVDYISAGGASECFDAVKMSFMANSSYKDSRVAYYELLKIDKSSRPRIVFFPLQYEPEASMTYAAPTISSQQGLVRKIMDSLPPGVLLVLKEHPNQLGALKLSRWKFVWDVPGVIPLHGSVNARDIIGISYAVFTISSTAGFEAAVMGVPTIVFTECHYNNLPAVMLVDKPCNLDFQRVVAHADRIGNQANLKEQTISALIDNSRFLLRGDPQPSYRLFDSQNLTDLATSISFYVNT